jgi:hypothetical protein
MTRMLRFDLEAVRQHRPLRLAYNLVTCDTPVPMVVQGQCDVANED